MRTDNAEKIVKIDELALDKECINLPTQYWNAAFNAAEARREVVAAKAALDKLESELSRSIRTTPGKYGLEKVTESAIRDVIGTQSGYVKASLAVEEATHASALCDALVAALGMKKSALGNLVELHKCSYFAKVKVDPEAREAVEADMQRDVRTRTRMERPG